MDFRLSSVELGNSGNSHDHVTQFESSHSLFSICVFTGIIVSHY